MIALLVRTWCEKGKVLLLGLVIVMLHASSFIKGRPDFSHHHSTSMLLV